MKNLLQNFQGFNLKIISTLALLLSSTSSVLAEGVTITSFGHSSLLIEGDGKSVLINPFKAVGCAEGLVEPSIKADVILASSQLADEGAKVAQGTFLVNPGSYRIHGLQIEGFAAPHDRLNGRRFGQATLWIWQQGGLNFAHLGGSAGSLTGANKVLIGRPDVLIIGVGGGAKVYDGLEASTIMQELKAKRVIPVQYVKGQTPKNCDQEGIEKFLDAIKGTKVREVENKLTLS